MIELNINGLNILFKKAKIVRINKNAYPNSYKAT